MAPVNIVAHELESHGVRTFSAKEMVFNILGIMHPLLFSITQVKAIWADLNVPKAFVEFEYNRTLAGSILQSKSSGISYRKGCNLKYIC
jgi:3-oxoacyl-ACP reductase-like protein